MTQIMNLGIVLILVMLIPEVLEEIRTLILYIYKLRHNGINNTHFTLIVEIVLFALLVAALFTFVSPLEKGNFIYAIIYCVNFMLAKGLNFAANTIEN